MWNYVLLPFLLLIASSNDFCGFFMVSFLVEEFLEHNAKQVQINKVNTLSFVPGGHSYFGEDKKHCLDFIPQLSSLWWGGWKY